MPIRSARNLVACLAVALASGPASAATLAFSGMLSVDFEPSVSDVRFDVPGSGIAQTTDDGSFHLLSLSLGSTVFGPFSSTITGVGPTTPSVRFTLTKNFTGSFAGISGGPPGGGPTGLQGVYRICVIFKGCGSSVDFPLTRTGTPARGFGVGGTQVFTTGTNMTLQNAPWTIGQPVVTIHNPTTTVTSPALPGGFAHGPGSATSSTAQASGTLQLVTVSKVYTELTAAFPEVALFGILNLHFVPEPGTLVLLGSAALALAAARRRRSGSH